MARPIPTTEAAKNENEQASGTSSCENSVEKYENPQQEPEKVEKPENLNTSTDKASLIQTIPLSSDDDDDLTIICKICDITFSSVKPYENHINGKKHKKMIKNAKIAEKFTTKDDLEMHEGKSVDDTCAVHMSNENPYCSICEIQFSGYIPYSQHMKSHKHKKNFNKLELKTEIQDVPDVTYNCEVKQKEMSESPICSLPSLKPYARCEVCDKRFSGPETLAQHISSKSHEKMKTASKMEQDIIKNSEEVVVQPNQLTEEKQQYIFECRICKKSLFGAIQFQQHMSSAMHKKHMNEKHLTEDGHSSNETNYTCKDCCKEFLTLLSYQQHIMSNNHAKQKIKNERLDLLASYPEIKVIGLEKEELSSSDSLSGNSQELFVCLTCHASFSGPESALAHAKGKTHLKAVQRKKEIELIKRKNENYAKDQSEKNSLPVFDKTDQVQAGSSNDTCNESDTINNQNFNSRPESDPKPTISVSSVPEPSSTSVSPSDSTECVNTENKSSQPLPSITNAIAKKSNLANGEKLDSDSDDFEVVE